MRFLFFFVVVVCLWSAVAPADAQVNVTQFHNHDSRDGLYVDAAFTPSSGTAIIKRGTTRLSARARSFPTEVHSTIQLSVRGRFSTTLATIIQQMAHSLSIQMASAAVTSP